MENTQKPVREDSGLDLSLTFHSLEPEKVLEKLQSPREKGLTSAEAARRQERFGLNELKEGKQKTFLGMVIDQLNNFVVILLIVAAIISAFLGEGIDAAAIIIIVILNTVMGVVQESRAQNALAALKKMAAPEAQVLRDGHRVSIPARELVPGDIVFLETGNFVPADVRLLEAVNLRIEEAALTGESVPVSKDSMMVVDEKSALGDRKNTAFMGTVVTYGRGQGVVFSTGMYTQIGLIARMLQAVEDEETPLQRKLDQLGKTLGWACLVISALVFAAGWLQGGSPLEMFMVAVSLAIAAVPEGLPAVVTISLALGMREMIRRHALIRRLSSVETLGSATVICSDKTGTLTQNAMTVTRVWADGRSVEISGSGYQSRGDFLVDKQKVDIRQFPAVKTALWIGALNNDAQIEEVREEGKEPAYKIIGDPTEGSLLVAARKAGAALRELNQAFPRENEVPFDSNRKRMITLNAIARPTAEDIGPFNEEHAGKQLYVIAVKGAPDLVLNLCNRRQLMDNNVRLLDEDGKKEILAANEAMTKDALRVLGMAYKVVTSHPQEMDPAELEKDLIFAGLVGMIDPAREEVKPALLKALKAGIRTVMITGDYPNTARAIAESIGLLRPKHRVVTGAELDQMDDKTLKRDIHEIDVFARVSPEHKMRIVSALRANDEVVAMTGDGVNDAPAIKAADIGVAMGITGTDVAKDTADMVLTDDNYASIVSAVEQGRIIYSNIRKFVYYLISCNMAEIMIIFLPTVFGRWLFGFAGTRASLSPLAPIQLLWLNLATDGAPALALGTEKGEPDIMQQQPRPPREPIINKFMQLGVVIQTIAITATTLVAYAIGLGHSDPRFAETMAFVTLSMSELVRAYTARSERYPLLKIGVFSNKWMNIAVLVSIVLVLMVVYVPFFNGIFDTLPLGLAEWELIVPLFLIPSLAAEGVKYFINWQAKRAEKRAED